jgi:peroxisomal enoyl-CoA hydratase 2
VADYLVMLSDPKIGSAVGFGGVILHGLSTFGFAARALLKAVAGGDPKALKFFGVRFTAPVKPGDALETQIWEVGPGPNGTTEVTFVTKNATTGKVSTHEANVCNLFAGLTVLFRWHWVVEWRTSKRVTRASCKS